MFFNTQTLSSPLPQYTTFYVGRTYQVAKEEKHDSGDARNQGLGEEWGDKKTEGDSCTVEKEEVGKDQDQTAPNKKLGTDTSH